MKRRILSLCIAQMFVQSQPRFSPLPLEVESLDKVPEPQRGLYVEKDGKYRLDVDGVEDVTGLKNSLNAAREDAKREKEKARQLAEKYKDVDPEKYKQMIDQLENGEDAKLLKEGGIDKVIERRTEKIRQAHDKALGELKAAHEQESGALKTKLSKYEKRVLADHIRAAAAKAQMHPSAVDDAILNAQQIFTLDEEANAVALDEDGKPILGKSGNYSVDQWIEEMKEKKPHWFPHGSSGGGSQGGGGKGAGGAKTIKRATFDGLSPQERMQKMRDGFTVVD